MKLNIKIERIANGFIVTEDGSKKYYQSMVAIAESKIIPAMESADKYFKEHDSEGEKRMLDFNVNEA